MRLTTYPAVSVEVLAANSWYPENSNLNRLLKELFIKMWADLGKAMTVIQEPKAKEQWRWKLSSPPDLRGKERVTSLEPGEDVMTTSRNTCFLCRDTVSPRRESLVNKYLMSL